MKSAPEMKKGSIVIINLSGRGDKDINIVAERMGIKL
jgi:tryptophan synthase beta chain